ncbi:MAG: biotin/lipoyl-binding protein, partial [Spirochaetales bacterium]|nr:biotin/lipoyl-binding protein [Spirochaetales bacterium]
MSKKKILIIAAVIIVAAVIIWWSLGNKKGEEESAGETTISTIEAVPGSVSIKVEGPSIVEPYQTRSIRSSIEGIVTKTVEEGDYLEAGEILISLDEGDMQITVKQAKINLSKAELNKDRNKTNLLNAEKNLEDTTKLFNSGAVSGEQV